MFYNSQKGYGLKDLLRNITRPFKPVLKPVLKEAKAIGAELAGNLIGDLVSGKSSKASVKARGNQAKNMAVQRALQVFQGGSGHSKSQRPTKRKRDRSKINHQNVNGPKQGVFIPQFIFLHGIILLDILLQITLLEV